MTKPKILVYRDPDDLARAAAEVFVERAAEAIADGGRFSVAMAGGNTPKQVYALLASEAFKERVEWGRVHVFFGDERCVPPEHPESNYRMVLETLLSKVPIPQKNVYRIKGELAPQQAAAAYEVELRKYFTAASAPRFDLVLLGMGEDGHTASLFPGSAALNEKNAWVAVNWVAQLNSFRITLTLTALNAAANIVFLVSGLQKAKRLAEVLNGPFDPLRLPAQTIRPTNGSLVWMLDAEAAANLREHR